MSSPYDDFVLNYNKRTKSKITEDRQLRKYSSFPHLFRKLQGISKNDFHNALTKSEELQKRELLFLFDWSKIVVNKVVHKPKKK